MMKLYDFKPAPNPRRVRVFAAEKGLDIPTVQIDLRSGEHMKPAFMAVNPRCELPVLELDDGTVLCESTVICRYLEAIHPEPALLGRDPQQQAIIGMWDRRVELDGIFAVGEAFRNFSRGFKGHALAGTVSVEQIPALAERGKARAERFFASLDQRLAESEYIAGDDFSVADITALVAVDFAGWIKLGFSDTQTNAKRWYEAVSARPSAKA